MITPVDIEQKEFTRGVRGYKEEEVDTFLNLIILEMENLIRTNREASLTKTASSRKNLPQAETQKARF